MMVKQGKCGKWEPTIHGKSCENVMIIL